MISENQDLQRKSNEYTIELTDSRSIFRAFAIIIIMGITGIGLLVGGAALLGNTSLARAGNAATGFFSDVVGSAGNVLHGLFTHIPDTTNEEQGLALVHQNLPTGGGLIVLEEVIESEDESGVEEKDEESKEQEEKEEKKDPVPAGPQQQPKPNPIPVHVETQEPEIVEDDDVDEESMPTAEEPEPVVIPEPEPEPEPEPSVPPGPTHLVSVVRSGVGDVVLQSNDYHISCGNVCSFEYPQGALVALAAYPENDAEFFGWGGSCSGAGTCNVLVTGPTTISASVGQVYTQVESEPDDPRRSGGGSGWVIVNEVMPGNKENTDDEFIELYNPTDHPILLSGWRILLKDVNGNETQLAPSSVFEGKAVPVKGYFLIGHSGLYQGAVTTDAMWPTRYSLRYSNDTIVLRDGIGTKVEEIHWEHIPVGRSWTRTSSDNQIFTIAVPSPHNSLQ